MSDPKLPYPGGEPPRYPGGASPQYPGATAQPGGTGATYPGGATPAYPGSAMPQYPVGAGQQPPPGGGYPAPPQGPQPMGTVGQQNGKGFFAALFDYSFNSFVTPTIVKFVYVLATIAIGLFVLVFVVAGFASNTPAAGLVVLFLAPIVGLIYLAFIRMGLEFCYALVRMSDDIHSRR